MEKFKLWRLPFTNRNWMKAMNERFQMTDGQTILVFSEGKPTDDAMDAAEGKLTETESAWAKDAEKRLDGKDPDRELNEKRMAFLERLEEAIGKAEKA